MKSLFTLSFSIFLVFSVQAQFSGSYATANWTLTRPSPSNGSVNTSGAPNSIILTGSDGASATNVDTDYTITTTATGTWSFNWSYHTYDTDALPQYDIAGVLINGVFTQLSSNSGGIDQSGTYSGASIPAGTVIGFRVRATDNQFGNATFTISSFSPPTEPLPIKLVTFNARQQSGNVLLSWQTASEINASHFEVERSVDGTHFNKIVAVPAGSASQQYSTIDATPSLGKNFYRLRMVDMDETYSYSGVLSVKLNAISSSGLYPNPASSFVALEVDAQGAGTEILYVYDAGGKLIKTVKVDLVTGRNKVRVDISGLVKGSYFIKVGLSGATQTFIKK